MATSDHVILCDRAYTPAKKSLLELTSKDALLAQIKLISNQIETLTETLNKLPQQLHVVQPISSFAMQVGGCNLCGRAHQLGICMTKEDASKKVNYMANPNRQGYHHGGNSRYHQGGNFSQNQGQDWRSYPGNILNKDQGGPSNRPPNFYERTTKLEDTLTQFMQVSTLVLAFLWFKFYRSTLESCFCVDFRFYHFSVIIFLCLTFRSKFLFQNMD